MDRRCQRGKSNTSHDDDDDDDDDDDVTKHTLGAPCIDRPKIFLSRTPTCGTAWCSSKTS